MSLKEYRRKRDFRRTDEPAGERAPREGSLYVIQKHAASRLHYDFRLELDGVLKSWAVPKGPSLDPDIKSLAVHVEDHPIEYGSFEGVIPQGEYGGGTVMLWDRGTWEPEGDAAKDYKRGKLVFQLHGARLKGRWALFRMEGKAGDGGKNWLLKKVADRVARSAENDDMLTKMTKSVAIGRTMEQIASNISATETQRGRRRQSRGKVTAGVPDRTNRRRKADRSLDPSTLEGAKRSIMPSKIAPELPSLVENVPSREGWLYELKLDGYRMICFVKEGEVSLVSRRGIDRTDRFATIAGAAKVRGLENAICDGEIVALRPDGTSDFQALQNMLRRADYDQIVFFVFDLLYYRGYDLRQVALIERKRLLSQLLGNDRNSGIIRYADHIAGHIEGDGEKVLASACGHRVEGIVAKWAQSHYREGRTTDWVKVKCLKRQEFVIGGWSEPSGARKSLGSLLVGYYANPSELIYCGRVGTGFTERSLRDLHEVLLPLEQNRSPFQTPPAGAASRGVIHWVKPNLAAEVRFADWTADGVLRQASFQGTREDKDPRDITLELPTAAPVAGSENPVNDGAGRRQAGARAQKARAKTRRVVSDEFAGVRLTHPDRIVFPKAGITKRDLAAYYASVASFILPHLAGRPLSLVRCPEGLTKPCFFQRHRAEMMPRAVRGVNVEEDAGTEVYPVIDDAEGLISLVQLGVLEFHPWGSRDDRIDRPDRLIFDVDPAQDVAWAEVVRAARRVKERLEQLGLESFVRTTGGKGAHVVVPIARRTSWEDLKSFARAIADALVREQPERYIAQSSKQKRAGRIFIDYLRNDRGATAVASFSTRARPGATVATPLAWDELSASLRPQQFTTVTVPERLRKLHDDPWQGFFNVPQSINRGMRALVDKW
jgi:bifunctional non-homologous end joining protein LigD